MYRTYRLLIKQNELGIYGVFNLIILSILLDERFVFRPRTECAFVANHKGSFFIFCNEFAVVKISIRIRAEVGFPVFQVDVIFHYTVVVVFHYRVVGLITAIISLESCLMRASTGNVYILQLLHFSKMTWHFLFLVLCHKASGKKDKRKKNIFHCIICNQLILCTRRSVLILFASLFQATFS